MSILKQIIEKIGEKIEITDKPTPSSDVVSKYWPEGVEYKGENVYDFYLKFLDWFEENTDELENDSWDEEICEEEWDDEEGEIVKDCWMETITREKQESYLGYDPQKDLFITGFDMWEGDENPAGIVIWKYLGKNKFKIIFEEIDYSSDMMYGRNGAYKKLHKQYKKLIDIRLD